MSWIEVRSTSTGRLMFRYDPARALIEIKIRDQLELVDLARFDVSPVVRLNPPGRGVVSPSSLARRNRRPSDGDAAGGYESGMLTTTGGDERG